MPATFPFRRMEARVWPPSLVLTFRPVQYAYAALVDLALEDLAGHGRLGRRLVVGDGAVSGERVEALDEDGVSARTWPVAGS